MQYIYYATTPAKTTSASPVHTACSLTYGFITSIVYILPKGCAGLVGVQLYKESSLVFPYNPNVWFTGDDINQEFLEAIDCTDGIPYVDLVTYNLDTLYAHTIEVVFTVTQPSAQTTGGGSASSGGGSDITPIGPGPITYTCPDGTVVSDPSDCPKTPITCPDGQHLENGVCVNDVVPPPPPSKITVAEIMALS